MLKFCMKSSFLMVKQKIMLLMHYIKLHFNTPVPALENTLKGEKVSARTSILKILLLGGRL